jgi:hypothetical protein
MDEFHFVAAIEQPDGTENRSNIGLLPVPSNAESAHRPESGPKRGAAQATRPVLAHKKPLQMRDFPMELAGLEPATSWVRSRRALALILACLQGLRRGGARSEARISASFRPFRLGSGQRNGSLARSPRPARLRLPRWPPFHKSGSDERHPARPGAHLRTRRAPRARRCSRSGSTRRYAR